MKGLPWYMLAGGALLLFFVFSKKDASAPVSSTDTVTPTSGPASSTGGAGGLGKVAATPKQAIAAARPRFTLR